MVFSLFLVALDEFITFPEKDVPKVINHPKSWTNLIPEKLPKKNAPQIQKESILQPSFFEARWNFQPGVATFAE